MITVLDYKHMYHHPVKETMMTKTRVTAIIHSTRTKLVMRYLIFNLSII